MRTIILKNAKLIIKVERDKITHNFNIISVFDTRTHKFWIDEQIRKIGINEHGFRNIADLKETLNRNLNNDSSKN